MKYLKVINIEGLETILEKGKIYPLDEIVNGIPVAIISLMDYEKFTLVSEEEYLIQEKRISEKTKVIEPKIFKIIGSRPLIRAMWEELEALGYILNSNILQDTLESDYASIEKALNNLDNFKELYSRDATNVSSIVPESDSQYEEVFKLPYEYDKALEFAKAQLDLPYWNINKLRTEKQVPSPAYKAGDWVTCIESSPIFHKEKGDTFQIVGLSPGSVDLYEFEKGSTNTIRASRIRLATEEEIKEARLTTTMEEIREEFEKLTLACPNLKFGGAQIGIRGRIFNIVPDEKTGEITLSEE